ncbi:DUF2179 [Desulfonema limicola]|uniref:DUF2179 n=1 Tax=Desulfonema limicola TaxID=45656 RepID=A0A975BC84_9BACT|nr:YitT family protein [Desulfonema limicola]QTA82595.1 DUF2179 [Desulfonema limicola]
MNNMMSVHMGSISAKKPNVCESGVSLQDNIAWNLTLITVGSILCAWVINSILLPQQFLSGGLSGVSLFLHYLFPSLSLGMLYFLLNIPIYILGWVYVGRRFFYYSLAGLAIFTIAVIFVKYPFYLEDKILSALFAGIVYGTGGGIILRSLGSAGGTDILSIILLKNFGIRIGSTILFFNASVLIISAFLFSFEAVLYTLIFMYVGSNVTDLVVSGLSKRKAVLIISPLWKEISHCIMHQLNRGVTLIRGEGGYSGKDENILYTVVTFRELFRLKEMVRQIDPNPFVVVSDTLEVVGQRIGNQGHW